MLKADNTWAHHKHFLRDPQDTIKLVSTILWWTLSGTLSLPTLCCTLTSNIFVWAMLPLIQARLSCTAVKKKEKEKGINKMKILKLTKSCKWICTQLHVKKNIFLVEFSLSTEAAHNCCFWNKGQNISGCKSTDAASQYPHYSTLLS